MTNNENESTPQSEMVSLNVEKVKATIPLSNSKKLCEMILVNRYFNMSKDITIACMEELAKRRTEGDDFNFEKYIEDSAAKMPVINLKIPDLKDVLSQYVKQGKK